MSRAADDFASIRARMNKDGLVTLKSAKPPAADLLKRIDDRIKKKFGETLLKLLTPSTKDRSDSGLYDEVRQLLALTEEKEEKEDEEDEEDDDSDNA